LQNTRTGISFLGKKDIPAYVLFFANVQNENTLGLTKKKKKTQIKTKHVGGQNRQKKKKNA
jgi:hypothetical protein